jgi:tetratricopeptide (TPR) repeat protein
MAMRHLGISLAVAGIVLALVPTVAAAGQTAPTKEMAGKEKAGNTRTVAVSFAAKQVAIWTTAVQTHTAGKVDEPVRTIAAWKPEYVTLVLRLVLPTAQPDTMVRALSLHTDIAIAERDALVQQSGPSGGSAVMLVDGRETRRIGRSYHWAIARQIAAALAAQPGEGPRVVAWYRAIAARLQEWGDFDTVVEHLRAGFVLFVDDPMLALYQGTLHQLHGDARLQQYVKERLSVAAQPRLAVTPLSIDRSTPSDLRRVPRASRDQLEAAEREFRRALSIDPTLHEARIRLAHVLSVLGDDRGAAETIRPALEGRLSPFFEGYAALILGRSEEHLGHYAAADEAYARAAARFPHAQSARIGRSRVALAQGRPAASLDALVDDAGAGVGQRDDPWLSHFREHDPDGRSQIAAWRKALP